MIGDKNCPQFICIMSNLECISALGIWNWHHMLQSDNKEQSFMQRNNNRETDQLIHDLQNKPINTKTSITLDFKWIFTLTSQESLWNKSTDSLHPTVQNTWLLIQKYFILLIHILIFVFLLLWNFPSAARNSQVSFRYWNEPQLLFQRKTWKGFECPMQ